MSSSAPPAPSTPAKKGGQPKSGNTPLSALSASRIVYEAANPEQKLQAQSFARANRRSGLNKGMGWRFLTQEQFNALCMRGSPPPETIRDKFAHAFDGVGRQSEADMYLGLTNGFRTLLSEIGCTKFTAIHTGSMSEGNGKAKDDGLSLLRPDISISPTHPEVAASVGSQATDLGTMGGDEVVGGEGVVNAEETGPSVAGQPVNTANIAQSRSSASSSTLLGTDGSAASPGAQTSQTQALPDKISARIAWAEAEVVIEVKHAKSDAHPFGSGPDLVSLLPEGGPRKQSRGQIIEYASEILRRQHRLFTFVVSICGDIARLLYLDRSGAIVSDPFDYRQQPALMGDFLWRVFGPDSAPEDRGHDPTVLLPSEDQTTLFKQLHTDARFSVVEQNALKHAATPGWTIRLLQITSQWAPLDPTYKRAVCASDATVTRHCLVGRPMFSSPSMVSRGTKVFVGYDLDAKIPVVIKDAWRHDRGPGCRTELTTYHELWRDRDPSKVLPFLTPLGGGDVYESAKPDVVQRTLGLPAPSPQLNPNNDPQWERVSERLLRIHVRLVLKEVCIPLTEFEAPDELVKVIYDAVVAQQLANDRGLQHRDVSVGNIFICPDRNGFSRGILGDWDMAKSRDELEEGATMPWRSGTWQFVSAILSLSPNKLHTPSDDLESTMHVLSWMVLNYMKTPWSEPQTDLLLRLATHFDNVIEYTDATGKQRQGCTYDKYSAVEEGRPIAKLLNSNHPLNRLLVDLANLCAQHYKTVEAPTVFAEATPVTPETRTISKYRTIVPNDDDSFAHPAHPRPSPSTSPATISSQAPPNELSAVPLSPLRDHRAFLSAFARQLNAEGWDDIQRRSVSSSTEPSTKCSIPPASRQAGDKRAAESTSQPRRAKRAKTGASSQRSTRSSTMAYDDLT